MSFSCPRQRKKEYNDGIIIYNIIIKFFKNISTAQVWLAKSPL